ncbi:hypothetical protein ACSXEK_15730 (plasmid) [Clostridium perfringens]
MAKRNEITALKKGRSEFNLVGKAKVGDFTFKMDCQSANSDWIYNALNLGIECGQNGTIYAEAMGGYGSERENRVYAHGKKTDENGRETDDFTNKITIDWEDRQDEEILKEVGDLAFFVAGLERDTEGKIVKRRFLSEYDFIQYIEENLQDGMAVNVKGGISYSVYNDNLQMKRKIKSIFLSQVEEKKARANGKNVDNRAKWGRVKQMTMKLQQAKLTVSAKGKHVVSTAQAKEIKEDNTNKVIGYKPDCHSSLPFDYDVVLRFFTETDKKTKERKFYAEVIKDRTHVTKVGSIIENCTYDVWKDYFENRTKKGYKSEANFTNDLKKSVGNVLNEAEKSEKLAEDIKTLIKELKGNEEGLASFKKKVSDMKIDLKALDMEDVDKLKELRDFIKSI